MLLSCSLGTFAAHGPKDALAAVRAAGLRYVDLPHDVADVGPWPAMLEENDLQPGCVEWSVSTLDELGGTFFNEPLARADRLGAAHVVVTVPVDAEDKNQQSELVGRMRQLGDSASEQAVTLCMLPQGDFCDGRWLGQAMAEIDHPAVALAFDTGGYLRDNLGSNGEVALQRVLGHIGAVRLTDFDEFSPESAHPALGLGGAVDFSRILQILQAIEFSGPCSIDFTPPESPDKTVQDFNDSVALLRDCGWLDP